jgi:hypothetical protein
MSVIQPISDKVEKKKSTKASTKKKSSSTDKKEKENLNVEPSNLDFEAGMIFNK